MGRIADALRKEYEAHHKVLQETDESAHVHVLWLRRMENAQLYVEEHFPDASTRKTMIGHIQSLRRLAGELLESRQ